MRIALVLYGLSAGNMNDGTEVNFHSGTQNIKREILNKYDVDVFLHTWNKENMDSIIKIFRPKTIGWEPRSRINLNEYKNQHLTARFYSMMKADNLRRDYEKRHTFKYDLVIVTNFNINLKVNTNLNRLNKKTFWLNTNTYGHLNLDHTLFITNSNDMYKFTRLFENIKDHDKIINDGNLNNQYVSLQIKKHNLNLSQFKDSEFNCKIAYCPGDLPINQFDIYLNNVKYWTPKATDSKVYFKPPKKFKIALCLHGLSGGKSSKKRLIKYDAGVKNLLETFGKYDTDVFCHTWSNQNVTKIIKQLKPKKFVYEKQVAFNIPKKYNARHMNNCFSNWYSYMKADQLRLSWEKETGATYDLVVACRFDIEFKINRPFNRWDTSHIYVLDPNISPSPSIKPKLAHIDYLFFGSPAKMTTFCQLFNHIEEYLEQMVIEERRLNGWFNHYAARIHIDRKVGDFRVALKDDLYAMFLH